MSEWLLHVVTAGWVAMGLCGDALFKACACRNSWPLYVAGVCVYACCSIPAVISFRNGEYMRTCLRWDCYSLIATPLIAVIVFREPLTLRRLAVVGLIAASMWLNDSALQSPATAANHSASDVHETQAQNQASREKSK